MKLNAHLKVSAVVFDVQLKTINHGGRVTLAQSAARAAVILYAREVMLMSYPEIGDALEMNTTSVRSRHLWAKRELAKEGRFWERLGILCRALGQSIDQAEYFMHNRALEPRHAER